MICARFFLRIKIHQSRRLLVSDLLMGAAWCAAFTTASFDVILSRKGALDPKIDYILTNYDASVRDYEYVARVRPNFRLNSVLYDRRGLPQPKKH
jgi:hypothetical protein